MDKSGKYRLIGFRDGAQRSLAFLGQPSTAKDRTRAIFSSADGSLKDVVFPSTLNAEQLLLPWKVYVHVGDAIERYKIDKIDKCDENEVNSVDDWLTYGRLTVVALIGELGTGKTVFARGIAKALGIKENVTSPTFTLIHEYYGPIPLYHMDLYRLSSVQEILDIGVEDYFFSDGICLVEWAEKLGSLFPLDGIRVMIRHLGNTRREIEIERP